MTYLNPKAIAIGAMIFAVLFFPAIFFIDFDSNNNGIEKYSVIVIFVITGFLTGYISKNNGVLNSAIVGLLVGVIANIIALITNVSGADIAALIFSAGIIFFSSLGGLIWQFTYALSNK